MNSFPASRGKSHPKHCPRNGQTLDFTLIRDHENPEADLSPSLPIRTSSDKVPTVEEKSHSSPIRKLLAFPFVFLIRAYRLISPLKQLIFGPDARCRFHPTCSEYALECF
ncbi:MAG: membrane protein insertion efficiency factor YidD, partial [Verrucomicrobiota bacterium]|nr:membrane protein insertion efficiency factor YidD [Verrucomicrobiota bacterium]